MIKTTTDDTFDDDVTNASGAVLVDIWAEWCGPCKAMNPILESLDDQFSGRLTIAKINADENPELVSRFGVSSIPTMILYVNGVEQKKIVGAKRRAELEMILSEHIITDL